MTSHRMALMDDTDTADFRLEQPGETIQRSGSRSASAAARGNAGGAGGPFQRVGEVMPAAEHADVRVERVAALRAAIAAGTYRVSAEALAECLMAAMQR